MCLSSVDVELVELLAIFLLDAAGRSAGLGFTLLVTLGFSCLSVERHVEACSKHCHLNFLAQAVVVGYTPNHVNLVSELGHEAAHLVNLAHLEFILSF